ncbi:MAG: acetyl-CoA hydrolase/transferase family protein [Bifidobacteriaceae bacterium]|jgi:succinyl-CoA:acetate CoA-transferase|nr:acetyl-CoA hydrolase/transferase family protein [Bifidobacteriaceae bacterium]
MSRIRNEKFRSKVVTAEQAAAFIKDGSNVGFSGFTGSGYPKAVPQALAARIEEIHAAGQPFRIGVFTGASTAPELDGVLAQADAIAWRMPYQSDPVLRGKINEGVTDYCDIHLGLSGPLTASGFIGKLDTAVIEITAITEDGELIPSSSLGNNLLWLETADQVILEVNHWQSLDLYGMHDVYYQPALPPHRVPIPIVAAGDRIGQKTLKVDPAKVVAVVETDAADRNSPFKPLDDESKLIAGHLLEFLSHEVKIGRLPKNLLPLQSGVGNIANAVLAGLLDGPFDAITSYTEVIQDGMVDLLDSGKMTVASATAFSLSPDYAEKLNDAAAGYSQRIILRPQDVSNNPEVIRRLGVIACNGLIEADIYGNVNSTHIMGSRMQNGLGGSGDFTRNAYISSFVTPSVAKGGAISCIVPMVSHVDHTEHDVQVIITEQGLADMRGLAPRKRARLVIDKCAHPDYKPALEEYFERAQRVANSQHTPHDLRTALGWHVRFLESGSMRE